MKKIFSLKLGLLASSIVLAACGGSSSSDSEAALAVLTGKAVYPESSAAEAGPAANASLTVIEVEREPQDEVASGETDEEGNYSVMVPGGKVVAVIVSGATRVSGLQLPLEASSRNKDFDGVTDIACEAGVSAVADGSLPEEEMNEDAIARLEAAAAEVVDEGGVDFADPASVSEAAARVRALTNDGRGSIDQVEEDSDADDASMMAEGDEEIDAGEQEEEAE